MCQFSRVGRQCGNDLNESVVPTNGGLIVVVHDTTLDVARIAIPKANLQLHFISFIISDCARRMNASDSSPQSFELGPRLVPAHPPF